MSDRITIRPKPGVELAGIPAAGATVDGPLAREWLKAGLVTRAKRAAVDAALEAPAAESTDEHDAGEPADAEG